MEQLMKEKGKTQAALTITRPTETACIYHGDCRDMLKSLPDGCASLIVSSPPYSMGRSYEDRSAGLETFHKLHKSIFRDMYRILKPSGSICWQVGSYVTKGEVFPLDIEVFNIFSELGNNLDPPLVCRGRIIWTFGHGLHCKHRFSGRYETILWFTKGEIRKDVENLPPYDMWDIPNVKGNHVEKTSHPCQYPIALPKRLIHALTAEGELVVDPFLGAGTSGAAAVLEKRHFAGAEMQEDYIRTAEERIRQAADGTLRYRADVPVKEPDMRTAQARKPREWLEDISL